MDSPCVTKWCEFLLHIHSEITESKMKNEHNDKTQQPLNATAQSNILLPQQTGNVENKLNCKTI